NTLCFMTGGTYTPSNTTFFNPDPSSTGSFTISFLTPLDIRSCLCERSDLSQSGGANNRPSHTHQDARTALGCNMN
ncbi:MAG: hypothetical protein OXD44_09000, partial [Gammaproteobacteria bacterium]|nr:hypothetical protein [Gammaproteobacteria bacterium]